MKYFVKLAGKAFGPLEEEKIVEMYHSGRLKDPVDISRDKKVWDSIDIILPKPAPPELPPLPPLPDLSPVELVVEDDDLLPVTGEITQKFIDPNGPVWFYSADGSKGYGPVTKSDLGTMLQCNMLNANSLVWRQGENSRPISVVPELIDIVMANSSSALSAGFGGEKSSVPPPVPENSLLSGMASHSVPNPNNMASSRTSSSGRRNSTNMFDLSDEELNADNRSSGRKNNSDGYVKVGQTSRMSYLLLALFLGQLGVHNFYASRMDVAIVQLFIGLSNLVALIIISFVTMLTTGNSSFLFLIPAVIAFGLELWAIIEMCIVTKDGTGKRMY